MANFTLTAGKDTVTGTNQNDVITGALGAWQTTDTITGGGGYDVMELTVGTPSTITDAMFQQVSGVSQITLSGKGSVTAKLDAAAEASGLFELDGSHLAGNLTVDASTWTAPIDVNASKGVNTLTGGLSNDYFVFTSASLNSKDRINGGGFGDTDQLIITDKAKIVDSAFTQVKNVEQLLLGQGYGDFSGQSATLGKLSVAAGINQVNVTDPYSTIIDASARTAGLTVHGNKGDDVFRASQGDDTFVADAGNDSYQVREAWFNSKDAVDGGIGRDEIRLLDSGTAIADADFTNVHGVETLAFNASGKQTVTLGAMAAQSGLDTIDASKNAKGLTLTLDNTMTSNLTVDLGTGADTLSLGSGGQHIVAMKSTSLTAADHLTGNTNDLDTLKFTDAVKLTDKFFLNAAHVDNFGVLVLDSGAKGQTFTAGANFKAFVQADGLSEVWADSASKAASVTFDFSKYDGPALIVMGTGGGDVFLAGAANNIYLGTSPGTDQGVADSFLYHSGDYTSQDYIFGGKSTADALVILDDNTAIADPDFQHTLGVEVLRFAAAGKGGYHVQLGASAQAAGIATVDASKAGVAVDVDAHSMTAGITILGGGKDNTLLGGKGDDTFAFAVKTLNAGDVVNGGASTHGDTLKLTTAGAVSAAALASVSGVEKIQLSDLGNAITVKDALIDTAETVTNTVDGYGLTVPLLIETGKGKDLVDLSQLVTHASDVAVIASAGDKYIASSGHDVFVFQKSSDLTAATQIVGGSGASEIVLAGGTYTAAQFHGLHNIGVVTLSDANPAADYTLKFDNADFQNSGGTITVSPSGALTGNLVVDASAATSAFAHLAVQASHGDDVYRGSGGSDAFSFVFDNSGHSELNANDTVAGGSGWDSIHISDSNVSGTTTLSDADVSHVSSIEQLDISSSRNLDLTLDSAFEAAGISWLDLADVSGTDKVDASAYHTDLVVWASGHDTIQFGAGNDKIDFQFGGRNLDSSVTLDGGTGHNTLEFSGSSSVADVDFSHVSRFQEIDIWGENNVALGAHSDAAGITTIDAGNASYSLSLNGSGSHLDLTLRGTGLSDLIAGGTGADHITGGGGGDFLTGNGGNDVFVYKSAGDSYQLAGNNLSHVDVIGDFHTGDELDIHALVNAVTGVTNLGNVGSFATADTAGLFAGNAVAVAFNGTDTRLYVDVNHDGNFNVGHDLVVQVSGNHVADLANTASYA